MSTDPTAGRFVWRELVTPALDPSRAFYTGLFGWSGATMDMGGAPYTMFQAGETQVGGMMAPMMDGVPPHWLDYITTGDVDADRARVVALGGTAITEAMDIPGVGRFAVVQDPAGAVFALFRSLTPGATPDPERPADHTFCWSQLMSTDVERVVPFYCELFGWTAEAMGDMVVFSRDGRSRASAMAAQMDMPSHWLSYVAVEDCDAAFAKASTLGAKAYVGPTDLPGMGRFAVLADPGGAVVALWKDAGAMA